MNSIKSCKRCIHYSHKPGDVPRCTKYPIIDILDKNIKYVEVSVARFDDFNLCGRNAIHFIEKKKEKKQIEKSD